MPNPVPPISKPIKGDEILKQTSNFSNESVPSEDVQAQLSEVESNRLHYSQLFDPEEHQKALERGDRRLSYKGESLSLSLSYILWENDEDLIFLFSLSLSSSLFSLSLSSFSSLSILPPYLNSTPSITSHHAISK